MRILILGSEGFIGKNLTRYLINKGYQVHCADIILKKADNYSIINPEAPDFSALFISHKYELCINATGAANVQISFSNPSLDYSLNTSNVYFILDTIRNHNPTCKFVNISSAAVY